MGKVEIRNFYCLIGDNKFIFLQKCLLNSSPHFIRLLSDWLPGQPKELISKQMSVSEEP